MTALRYEGTDERKRIEAEMRVAAEAAALLVADGMTVGLGTGSTVGYVLRALAADGPKRATFVATSPRTERAARELGLRVRPFTAIDRLDVAIDGADEIGPDGWLVKGGGGAHTREKIVAAAADRFAVVASSNKLVPAIRPPIPLELHRFGAAATMRRLGRVSLRVGATSPDGGVIADFLGPVGKPRELAERLSVDPGVVEHGLFPPELVATVLVARGRSVERIEVNPPCDAR